MFSVKSIRLFLLFLTIGFCSCDFERSCVYIEKINGVSGLKSFSELKDYTSLLENLNLIKNFKEGKLIENPHEEFELRLVQKDKKLTAVHRIKINLSSAYNYFQDFYVGGVCDLEDKQNEINNYFLNTHCITKINFCVYDRDEIFVIGESVEGEMSSAEVSTWYKGQDIKVKLEILKNFALGLENFHKKNYFHNELSPEVLYLKNSKDKSVMIRYRELTEFNLTPKKFLYFPSYSLPKIPLPQENKDTKADIYNLAMSFVLLESSNSKIIEKMNNKCLSVEYTSDCHNTLIANVKNILKKATLSDLTSLITKAIQFKPSDRYESIETFKIDIKKVLEKHQKAGIFKNLIV